MPRIIGIKGDTVQIRTESGKIIDVNNSQLNFLPEMGDEIEVFRDGNRVVVSKKQYQTQNGIVSAYMVNKKPVSKTAYCLLAFFLGGIGIHKFYSGRIAAGILYLLFCWTGIPAFIAFIEFIIGICKESDSNGMIWV